MGLLGFFEGGHEKPPNKFTIWIGAKVREARMEANLTQAQLADLTYNHVNTVRNIEGGKTDMSITNLALIATALEKPVSYFMPVPGEYRANVDELPTWIREAVIHMKRITRESNQKVVLATIKTVADTEMASDIEDTNE